MYVGRDTVGGRALALLLIDNPVDGHVIAEVRDIENVLSARAIHI
jgi:hypothetical protein